MCLAYNLFIEITNTPRPSKDNTKGLGIIYPTSVSKDVRVVLKMNFIDLRFIRVPLCFIILVLKNILYNVYCMHSMIHDTFFKIYIFFRHGVCYDF